MNRLIVAGRPMLFASAIALMMAIVGCQELIITTGSGNTPDTTTADPGLPDITGSDAPKCDPGIFAAKAAASTTSSAPAVVVPNSYIVVLNDGVGDAAINELRGTPAMAKFAASDRVFHSALNGFAGQMTAAQADRLRSDSRVKYVERNYRVQLDPHDITANSTSGQAMPWGVSKVGGSRDGSGRTAWIIDTGIDLYNPDLNVDLARSRNFVDEVGTPAMDGNGHGTHIAGIIGARDNSIGVVGVAANAQLVAVRVLNDTGAGNYSTIIEGLDYATANARSGDVINLSLGGPPSHALDDAVRRAAARGIKVVVAAGNEMEDAGLSSPSRVNYPGVYTVSAFDINGDMASFSNYGSVVDVSAPGVRILSTRVGGGTVYMSGTSMAAPHVAGLLLFGSLHGSGYVTGDPDGCDDAIAYR
ncbi:MAG: S8 family serine peptidase [Candidatus Kapaibacterium sp.]